MARKGFKAISPEKFLKLSDWLCPGQQQPTCLGLLEHDLYPVPAGTCALVQTLKPGGFGSPPFLPTPPTAPSQAPPPEILLSREAAAPTTGDTFSKTHRSYPAPVSCQFLFAYRMLCFPILFLSASWSNWVPFSSPPWGPPTSHIPGPSPLIPTAGCQWWLRFSGQEWAVALNLSTDCFASAQFDSFISTGQHGCREPYFNCKQLILCAALSPCCLRLPVTTA